MHEDKLKSFYMVFLGYWGFSGYGELRGGGITASNFSVDKRNQESLFIQATHHVHSQESAEILCICKHFVL